MISVGCRFCVRAVCARCLWTGIRATGECVYCGGPSETVDHVIPLARGGWEHESNLVPACRPCNSGKKDRSLAEWDPVKVARAIRVNGKVATLCV